MVYRVLVFFLFCYHFHIFNMQVATDAFEVLATSVQSTSKQRNDINFIQSTQTIEDFAFKYASFNLNASNTEERKENKHIGKKT